MSHLIIPSGLFFSFFILFLIMSVKRNQQQYELPLKIVSYSELYGWSMDQIVKEVGLKNNCERKRLCILILNLTIKT